jgi:hypothetical protein
MSRKYRDLPNFYLEPIFGSSIKDLSIVKKCYHAEVKTTK